MEIREGYGYRWDGGGTLGRLTKANPPTGGWCDWVDEGGSQWSTTYLTSRLEVREYGQPTLGETLEANEAKGAVKYDGSKPPLHLIAPDFLYAVAEILDFGAKKYAPRNWEKGMDWSRCYRAAIGHLFDWFLRKGPDPETGKSHLWHAACCIMFLVCYEIRNVGTDDRP
jgi:hypothetical protein